MDSLKTERTVEVVCTGLCCRGEWTFWVDSLDKRLPDGPFICPHCAGEFPQKKEDN